MKHDIEQVQRWIGREIAAQQRESLIEAPDLLVRGEQLLRHQRQIGGILSLDPLPRVDGLLGATLRHREITEQDMRAHAFAVHAQRPLENAACGLGATMHHFRLRHLAVEVCDLSGAGVTRDAVELARGLDGLLPVLLLLVDLEQELERLLLVRRALELQEQGLGTIQQPGLEIVLGELVQRDDTLIVAQVSAIHEVLMHPDGPLHLATPAEQAAQREVQLDRLRIDFHHFDERFDGLVGLLVDEKVQPLEVGRGQRARLGEKLLDVDPRRQPAQGEEQRETQRQPPELEFHACYSSSASG